jgi:hypothetical protein
MKRLAITVIALLALAQPAFAGWYLMAPPRNGAVVDTNAPLSRWELFGSYDQSSQCEYWNQRDLEAAVPELNDPELRERERERKHPGLSPDVNLAIDLQSVNGKCIATDDARLVR